MAVSISKTKEEIQQLPLVELACEILKAKREPFYFRDLMSEIQELRSMSEDQVMEAIARLYTEINIDGRFVCIGQNVWGLKRWYPVDKITERSTSKRFVRSSGDAFSEDDEDLDDYDEEADLADEVDVVADDADEESESDAEFEADAEDEEGDFAEDDEDADADADADLEEEFTEDESDDSDEEDEQL